MRLPILILAALCLLPCPSTGASFREAEARYKVDNAHSSLLFRVKHLDVAYFYGCFKEFSGSFSLNEQNPEKSRVELEIRAGSVDSRDPKRDQHLRSPDFFNAKQFPVIRFESTTVQKEAKLWKVTGKLTLRGTTREITIPMTETGSGPDPWGGERIGFEGQVTIQRTDFGIDYAKSALGNDVRLIISLECVLQKD